jgi:hypothetical protein
VIAVWFSCGVASAVAAKVTLDKFGYLPIRILNTPVVEEDEDNLRFKDDVEKWLGVKVETLIHSKWPNHSAEEIWKKYGFMSNNFGAECTRTLKKGARYEFEKNNEVSRHVLGFTAEEGRRVKSFIEGESDKLLPVLYDAKITKAMCFDIIKKAGIKRTRPEVFAKRSALSREIGCRLTRVKNKRIFLDELKVTDKGRKMKDWDCGVFCEPEISLNNGVQK